MLTFQCLRCRAAFADLGLFWRHLEVRHGIGVRAHDITPDPPPSAEALRLREYRRRKKVEDAEFAERERRRQAARRRRLGG